MYKKYVDNEAGTNPEGGKMVTRKCEGCGDEFEVSAMSNVTLCEACWLEADAVDRAARQAWQERDSSMFQNCRDGLD